MKPKNLFRYDGECIRILVSTPTWPFVWAAISVEDIYLVTEIPGRWYAVEPSNSPGQLYAANNFGRGGKLAYLHQAVLFAPPGMMVDHVDGCGLNCQRSNLRVATSSENQTNRRKQGGTTSRYKGVSFIAEKGRWMAQCRIGGRYQFLGYFDDEVAAARAYDAAAAAVGHEFAKLNFPEAA